MIEDDIFNELLRMRRRIERLMKSLGSVVKLEEIESFPIDVSETENEIIVRADLPGFSKEEVSVNVTENSVTIEAKHKEKREEREERYYVMERKFGTVRRVITLPSEVEPEEARAKMKDGVLEIILPKKEKKKGRNIKIE